jgi:two-component system, LuxR family, response regulator FixJ
MVEHRSPDIVVVDDDVAVLQSYQFMLELAGYQVSTYSSAVDYLNSGTLDERCMILDHQMPQMTGLELAAMLRQREIRIPIMLVTSSPTAMISSRAAELGIKKVLEKPPDEDELLAFICGSASA